MQFLLLLKRLLKRLCLQLRIVRTYLNNNGKWNCRKIFFVWGKFALFLIVPRAWDISYTQPCINCQGKSATHFVYFWNRKTLPYTHLEATSYIPQQGQSLLIWNTSLSTTGCYKNKYTIEVLKLACMSRFAAAISSSKTELALGTIRVNREISRTIIQHS